MGFRASCIKNSFQNAQVYCTIVFNFFERPSSPVTKIRRPTNNTPSNFYIQLSRKVTVRKVVIPYLATREEVAFITTDGGEYFGGLATHDLAVLAQQHIKSV